MPKRKRAYSLTPRKMVNLRKRRKITMKNTFPRYLARRLYRKMRKTTTGTVELKNCDQRIGQSPIDEGGNVYFLAGIAQGTNVKERIGSTVYAKWLHLRYDLTQNASGSASTVRIIVFQDLQQVDSVILIPPAQVLELASFNSLRKFVTRKRFKILSDRTYVLVKGQSNQNLHDNVSVKLNTEIEFSDPTSLKVSRNGIYVMSIGSSTSNKPYFNYDSRIYYTDK